ncbi:helix-turn-helix domain-containing protein [Chitinophaga sp. CF418]|uniref:helix-turn-helix domain-containing protein n=1 Tax=Chitinophaga sp. CF418 TaxID=1855287 RepID=UPI00165FD00D|nr:AraC family transcriptional regulator [Chitinophaga sp. CF418]
MVGFQSGFVHPDLKILRKLNHLVEIHFKENKAEAFYSEQLGISIKVLNKFLRTYKNTTLHKYIQNRVHAEAISLLIGTIVPIKLIAYELGYSDPAYFNRKFLKREQCTPRNFRGKNSLLK